MFAHATVVRFMRCRAMPRFFFHVIDDLDCPDAEGAELPDLDAAKDYGARGAVSLMADLLLRERRVALHHRIDIRDEGSKIVASLKFRTSSASRISSEAACLMRRA